MAKCIAWLWLALCVNVVSGRPPEPGDYFRITVVDEATGRGVPLVELRTVNQVRYITDSAGVVAYHEPGVMNTVVFFEVSSHGYEFPADHFGYRGARLKVTPGGSAVLQVQRINIAERLYRVTGGGIYRDSILVGDKPPNARPVLNAQVFGSDSVVNAIYRGKIYWFWGDTNRPSYPLGNFHVPGATSLRPCDGGLDPEVGVDLEYFVDKNGFAKPTAQMPGDGPTWINGLVVLTDKSGHERMFATYVKIKPPMAVYERGMVEFNDNENRFEHRVTFPQDAPITPHGHPLKRSFDGVEYICFGDPYPDIRVRATAEDVLDLTKYEAFTFLERGSREDRFQVDRHADGTIRYDWRPDAPVVTNQMRDKMVRQKQIRGNETLLQLRDVDTGKRVVVHRGTVCWNEYRQKYVMITTESFGTSLLGETWYAESDRSVGPWVYARKVVTHQKYSFYNPKQHPVFDKLDGRIIFFEGTYTSTFSGNPDKTPWYDYNQIMYKLDLGDARLALPVPVYHVGVNPADRSDTCLFALSLNQDRPQPQAIAWFALDRQINGSVPVYVGRTADGRTRIAVGEGKADTAMPRAPLCFALPVTGDTLTEIAVPLYEYVSEDGASFAYSTGDVAPVGGGYRSKRVICRVWPSPFLP